jgi:UDP-GlcNAc:undecaprenyl-phosphate GlcNAc-1-phosphate transferase
MPTLGGLAILAGLLAAALIFLPNNAQNQGIIAGALIITFVGAIDDIFDLSPPVKLVGQFIGVLIPVLCGVVVDQINIRYIGVLELGPAAGPLTIIGIVAVINIVNLSDGVDGLAAGVCFIAAITFAVIALSLDRDAAGILAACTAGAALGFFCFTTFILHPFLWEILVLICSVICWHALQFRVY